MQKVAPPKIIYIQPYFYTSFASTDQASIFFLIFKNQLFAADFLFYKSELV